MIINGEYKYLDLDKYRQGLIDGFTEYYGEKYRNRIERKINSVIFHTFHNVDYINEYYNAYMLNLKDEILDEFYKITGCKKSEKIESVLFKENQEILSDNAISIAHLGTANLNKNELYTTEGNKIIQGCRQELDEAFKLKGTDELKFRQYNYIYKKFLNAVRNVEANHDCAVIRDFHAIEENKRVSFAEFYRDAYENGYKFSMEDMGRFYSKIDFLYSQNNFDCSENLYDGHIENPGLISAFTSESNDIMKSGNIYEKLNIMIKRIRYAISIGADTRLDEEYLIKKQSSELSKKDIAWIIDEYEYLMKNFEPDTKNLDYCFSDNLKKQFKKGQFFPEDLADTLEDSRKFAASQVRDNCESALDQSNYISDYFTNFYYKNGKYYKPASEIYLLENNSIYSGQFLTYLAHEVNHAFSFTRPIYLSFDKIKGIQTYLEKRGVEYFVGKRNHDNILKEEYYSNHGTMLNENINERQTIESLEYLKKYIDFSDEEDDLILKDNNKFYCYYTLYDCITEEFYELFHDELKLQTIDPLFDICAEGELPVSKMEAPIYLLKTKFSQLLNKNEYYKHGTISMSTFEKYCNVIETFYNDIIDKYKGYIINKQITVDKEFSFLPPLLRTKAKKLMAEAHDLVEKMRKEREIARKHNSEDYLKMIDYYREADEEKEID